MWFNLFQVLWRVIGISPKCYFNRENTAYFQPHLAIDTVYAMLNICVKIWDTAFIFVAKPKLLLWYDWRSTVLEHPQHMSWISLWQMQHSIFTYCIWQWRQSRQYWVLVSEYETQGAYHGKAAALCTIWLKVRCTGESLTHVVMTDQVPYILQSHLETQRVQEIWDSWVRIRDIGPLVHGVAAGFDGI